jgi:hypothetical protein
VTRWWTFAFRAENQFALATVTARPADLTDRVTALDARLRNLAHDDLQPDEVNALNGLLRTVQQLSLNSSGDD